jgi:hypothetical protein
MWIGRLVPIIAWAFWLIAILVPGFGPNDSSGAGLLFFLWILSLAAYLLWVYFLLPELLFKGAYRGIGPKSGYFFFTGLTAGIGPVIWYFLEVDSVLRQMAAARK